jgi:hypothetical protein
VKDVVWPNVAQAQPRTITADKQANLSPGFSSTSLNMSTLLKRIKN